MVTSQPSDPANQLCQHAKCTIRSQKIYDLVCMVTLGLYQLPQRNVCWGSIVSGHSLKIRVGHWYWRCSRLLYLGKACKKMYILWQSAKGWVRSKLETWFLSPKKIMTRGRVPESIVRKLKPCLIHFYWKALYFVCLF